ncbi:glutaredoxin 3 [Candidatus Curculioniphilus buchneri]|uniref:glutaredoxin 3 n=1 Tax=Candidatus Curculioniphilus buchneri TaxID=690594 RepID=UPI00376F036C
MANVKIYTKSTCSYCQRAKDLLSRRQISYQEITIDHNVELRNKLIQSSGGCTTVPQIFIDGKHVGGYDDLYALDANGGLSAIINK